MNDIYTGLIPLKLKLNWKILLQNPFLEDDQSIFKMSNLYISLLNLKPIWLNSC
jgi:hypothetical protein